MHLEIEGKVALISGGASGIGESVVRLLAEEGARAVIVDRDQDRAVPLADALQKTGAAVHAISLDLSSAENCRLAVAQTLQLHGRLDILVNNAGVNDSIGLDRSPSEFMQSIERNLLHVFALTHHAREALVRARGAIVNVSSKVSVTGQGRTSGYAAAKGAVNALTREWALALADDGVRVNCVVPAECATPQYERWFKSLPDPGAARAAIERLVPLGRRMTAPDEVAAMIAFLASPRSGHTTGQIVFVDGGYTHLDRAATHSHQKWG